MIFLKRYKKFMYEHYTNEDAKVTRISELYVSFVKYITKRNIHTKTMCNKILENLFILENEIRNINGVNMIVREKLSIFYDGAVSYNIEMDDCKISKSIELKINKTINVPIKNFDCKLLLYKQIDYHRQCMIL